MLSLQSQQSTRKTQLFVGTSWARTGEQGRWGVHRNSWKPSP